MTEPQPIEKEALFAGLPPPWPDDSLRRQIARRAAETRRCVVALDDDPTGTQTVHGIWVVTRWGVDDLRAALRNGEPALYVLTNSRSLPLDAAQALNRAVAANLVEAARAGGRPITVVSRSDSTLRGHYPGEVDALGDALAAAAGVPFDGVCLIPFFAEGGRFTVNDVHWVQEGSRLIPSAHTPYARDSVFGYRHSRMPEWVEEKTAGRVPSSAVLCVSLEALRRGGPREVAAQLRQASRGRVIVVNAAEDRDLEAFVAGLQIVEAEGKRFLFRTAASFVKVAAGIADKGLLTPREIAGGRHPGGGMIVFGSHVPKSTAQLARARELGGVEAVELPVGEVLDGALRGAAIARAAAALNAALAAGRDSLLFTSRNRVTGGDRGTDLSIGKHVSSALVETVHRVDREPRYVIGKGGITSSDLAVEGMGVRAARVLGQVLPGVPVWALGPGSRWPGMPYVVFPGNVGGESAVADVMRQLRG